MTETTIKFYLDGELVGTQTAELVPTQQPIVVSQQVTIGDASGTLDASFEISEVRDSGEDWESVEYNRVSFSPGGVAEFDNGNVYVHYVEKHWKDGELVVDREGSPYNWTMDSFTYYYHKTSNDPQDRYEWDSYEQLKMIDIIELHFTSVRAYIYTDAGLDRQIGGFRPVMLGLPFRMPQEAPEPDMPVSPQRPKWAFAGWHTRGYTTDTSDTAADATTPWPWNPGEEITITAENRLYRWSGGPRIYDRILVWIVSDPADRRGGKRRRSFYPETKWIDGYRCIPFFARWRGCTGMLIRDDEAGHLMRDDTTGRLLVDL